MNNDAAYVVIEGVGTPEVTVEYVGKIAEEDDRAVTLSAMRGLLADVVHEPVTFVFRIKSKSTFFRSCPTL